MRNQGFFEALFNKKRFIKIIKRIDLNVEYKNDGFMNVFFINIKSWYKIKKKFLTTQKEGRIKFSFKQKAVEVESDNILYEFLTRISYNSFEGEELRMIHSNDEETKILGFINFLKRVYKL